MRSNLGGQGGRCTVLGACDELQTSTTPHEIYLTGVGVDPADGLSVDLRIVNTTECGTVQLH